MPVAYDDIDHINALLVEQQNIQQALSILDDHNGTVPACTIAPVDEGGELGRPPSPEPVVIALADPPQSLVAGVRSGLIQRNNEINKELRDLGVENVPEDKPGGGPPGAEAQPA